MSDPLIGTDLFGEPVYRYRGVKEEFGTWPTTVWEVRNVDPITQELKESLGDNGEAREECFSKKNRYKGMHRPGDKSVYRGKVTVSVFSPEVCSYVLNMYAPSSGVALDPFAGGGTRAILSAAHGLRYFGTELREAETVATRERIARAGYAGQAFVVCADARECDYVCGKGKADFLLTCPPYWNLEEYGGPPGDLSMEPTYAGFLSGLEEVVAATARALRPGAVSCWVVGLHRDKDGGLLCLQHDLAAMHRRHGFRHKEEVILYQKNGSYIHRVGQFRKGDKRLVRNHEYLCVFVRE